MDINTLKKIAVIIAGIASIAWIDPSYDKTKEGNELYFDGKYDEAAGKYVDAQMNSSAPPAALDFNIADVQYKTEKYEEAIAAYEKAIKNTNDVVLEAKANFNIGNALYRQGKHKEALEMYKRTVELTEKLVNSNSTDTETAKLREDAKYNHEFVEKKIEEMLSKQKDRQEKQEDDKEEEEKEKKEQPDGDGQKKEDQNRGEEKQDDQGEKNEQENGQDQDNEKETEGETEGEKQDQDEQEKDSDKGSKEDKENRQEQQPMDTQNKLDKHSETGMTEEEASRLLDAIQQNEENNKMNMQLEHTKGAHIDKDW
ncbi:MAG: tetratricopeptide repeat protein [Candidatus Anammoxibacter sp.]